MTLGQRCCCYICFKNITLKRRIFYFNTATCWPWWHPGESIWLVEASATVHSLMSLQIKHLRYIVHKLMYRWFKKGFDWNLLQLLKIWASVNRRTAAGSREVSQSLQVVDVFSLCICWVMIYIFRAQHCTLAFWFTCFVKAIRSRHSVQTELQAYLSAQTARPVFPQRINTARAQNGITLMFVCV